MEVWKYDQEHASIDIQSASGQGGSKGSATSLHSHTPCHLPFSSISQSVKVT